MPSTLNIIHIHYINFTVAITVTSSLKICLMYLTLRSKTIYRRPLTEAYMIGMFVRLYSIIIESMASIYVCNIMYIMYIYLHSHTESATDDVNIGTILQEHTQKVCASDIQRINIRQSHLLDDAISLVQKATFCPGKTLKVRFIGEPAVDDGGPRREFFRGCHRQPLYCFHFNFQYVTLVRYIYIYI